VQIIGRGVTLVERVTGRRDFSSARSIQADRYDLLADADPADEARDLLPA
jgi:hypothetical protein